MVELVYSQRFTVYNTQQCNHQLWFSSKHWHGTRQNKSFYQFSIEIFMIYNPSIHHLLKNIKTVETLSVWCWHETRDFILLRSGSISFWTSWRWIVRANRHQTNTSAQWDKRSWWFPFKIIRQYEFGTIWI